MYVLSFLNFALFLVYMYFHMYENFVSRIKKTLLIMKTVIMFTRMRRAAYSPAVLARCGVEKDREPAKKEQQQTTH